MQPDRERLEEGLESLRRLGYLQTPAELFVAERVPPRGGALKVALSAALWLGVGGGVVVGLLLAAGAVAAEPALLDRPGDLAWLVGDLLAASCLGLALCVGLFTGPAVAWLRRRGAGERARAEFWAILLPSVALSLYLTDLSGRAFLPRLPGPWWGVGAVLTVIAAALAGEMLGRLQRTVVVVARLRRQGRVGAGPRLAAWIRGGALLLAALLLLAGPYRSLRPLPRLDQVRAAPPTTSAPLLVLAVDGLDRAEAADLPFLGPRLAQADSLESSGLPRHPAAFWSSVATGFAPEVHGLRDAAASAPAGLDAGLGRMGGSPVLAVVLRHLLPGMGLGRVQASDQRELVRPPFWEIAVHAGLRARVVNWWATFPAARHPGLEVVSDRWYLRRWEGRDALPADRALLVQPPALVDSLRSPWDGPVAPAPEGEEGALLYARAADRTHARLAGVGDPEPLDLRVVLLGGLDVRLRAEGGEEGLRAHEAEVDALAAWLARRHRGPVVLVASRLEEGGRRAWVWPARTVEGRSVEAVAPALLEMLGIPPARDMGGGPAGPRTWGRRPAWTPSAPRTAADLERLRSLGYIGGS